MQFLLNKILNKIKKKNEPFRYIPPQIIKTEDAYSYENFFIKYEHLFKQVPPCKQPKNINIIAIADTHGCLLFAANGSLQKLRNELNQGCDVVVCLGDIRKDELKIIEAEVNNRYPIIGISGNHDDIDQFEDTPNIINLHMKTIKIKDITIAGFEGTIRYKIGEGAFYTQEECLNEIKKMPPADILITHAHMYRENDKYKSKYDCHIGFVGTLKYFYDNRCFLNIHGHDHLKSDCDTQILKNGGQSIGIYQIERIKM